MTQGKSKLPKVFHNDINKNIDNNNKIFYSATKEKNASEDKPINITKKINDIFSSPNYIYKADVEITTKSDTYTTKIIGRNKSHLITMENKTIPISEIKNIKTK